MSPLLEVTEDTPPDMLTGSMDLRLVLPDGNRVRMSVDRRTPMMDLLVQVTTAYKISMAGNVLQPYGESGILPYKPSTPIGALDTWIVHIVPKNQAIQNPSNKINLKQIIPPFEQTMRFQVNLPRNQLYVTRVSGRCSMSDILLQACKEKNLDHTKYTVRHPKHLDKPLCDEMSIAEYGHNQVTMISLKNLPTAVSTDDILMMNKYKAQQQSDSSGSGSPASSSVSPVPPAQPSKPLRKRRPAPKPPALQQKQQQNETIICHSRTSSDSSGYHEASVLSESPDSNNSSLPDSLPRRSKLPPAEPKVNTVESKLSRSLSNLHQASTSVASCSGLKPAQSTSCLVQARKKKPAPPPPTAIAEEKEEKSATLPASARLLDNQLEETDAPLTNGIDHRSPSPIDDQVLVTREKSQMKAPVPKPRPRSTAFEMNRPDPERSQTLSNMSPESSLSNTESENARLEAEIERMFEQATREHVSLESGVELSRGPSPDWNWEYRLPAPPTFRDDVTTPSLADLQRASNMNSKQVLFSPLESKGEVAKEEPETEPKEMVKENPNLTPVPSKEVTPETKKLQSINENIHITPHGGNIIKNSKICTDGENENIHLNGHVECVKMNGHSESNVENPKQINKIKKTEKVYITQDVNSHKEIIQITPKTRIQASESSNNIVSKNITVKNQRNSKLIEDPTPKITEVKADKVCINIKNNESKEVGKNIGRVKVERSDTVIRVNGRPERSQEQSAILNELTTVITERQTKPKESKPVEPVERPQALPLKNFSITTYSGSKPVEIYKDKSPIKEVKQEPEVKKEVNGIMRSNSSAEEKKGPTPVKRSASVVTNLQRRLDLSRSNGNLLEVDEFPFRNFRSNLRKTTSELSINIDPEEQKEIITKQETGLQSLQVLRTILPQLSQSQGALNRLEEIDEKKEDKPAVCLTTWGERPKRQVSIKTDRDYTTSGLKLESQASVSVEVVSPSRPVAPLQAAVERRPRTSVYRSIETGNTKAIRLPPSDLGRLPIVRAVELKKHPDTIREDTPATTTTTTLLLNGGEKHFLPSDKTFPTTEKLFGGLLKSTRPESRQIRPPSYLFGCEPKVPPPPPAPMAPPATMVKLKPVSQRGEMKKKQPVSLSSPSDPRDELLASIRSFGKSSLRKVSTR